MDRGHVPASKQQEPLAGAHLIRPAFGALDVAVKGESHFGRREGILLSKLLNTFSTTVIPQLKGFKK